MLKRELADGIILYTFEPDYGKYLGCNILALVSEKKVILIDTGYEEQALQVLQDINDDGLTIEKIFISHFHCDHMYGLKVLPKVPIYGSSHYQVTHDEEEEKETCFNPTVVIHSPINMNFGKHQLTLIPFPGHSMCSTLIAINDKYVFIGDELFSSNDGKPALPWVRNKLVDVRRQLDSLNRLKHYSRYVLIPAHGAIISGEKNIECEVNRRIIYLNAILSSNGEITYENSIKDCGCKFLHSEWHRDVYE